MEEVAGLGSLLTVFFIPLVTITVLPLLARGSLYVVKQQTNYIIERSGKFHKVPLPELRIKIPIVDRIAKKVPLHIMQLDSVVETKTKDSVFVTTLVSVQYQVQNVADSYYRLADPKHQIRSYVYDRMHTSLTKLNLDGAFSSKNQIAQDVETILSTATKTYGFAIINTLVTNINPDPTVRVFMNSVNTAQRERKTAISLTEVEKIEIMKQAEADAEYKRLQGEGIAWQRKTVVDGLVEQYESLRDADISNEAQEMLLFTRYFGALQEVAKASNTQTLMLPSNPGGVNDAMAELRNSLFVATRARRQTSGANSRQKKE